MNKQNTRYWSSDASTEQGVNRLIIWCGIWNDQIIGPFFFDNTMNGETYQTMFKQGTFPDILILEGHFPTDFQQDDAPALYILETRN